MLEIENVYFAGQIVTQLFNSFVAGYHLVGHPYVVIIINIKHS